MPTISQTILGASATAENKKDAVSVATVLTCNEYEMLGYSLTMKQQTSHCWPVVLSSVFPIISNIIVNSKTAFLVLELFT